MKDPRFDLACYGTFLSELPKRLGTHDALDASASALICAYPAVYNRQPTCEALTKYGKALQVLRLSLETPRSENVVEVLCAVYFLLICQVRRLMIASLSTLTKVADLDCEARRRDNQSWQSCFTDAECRSWEDSCTLPQRRIRAPSPGVNVHSCRRRLRSTSNSKFGH